MNLVDTSLWIEFLRSGGNPKIQERVEALLVEGSACTAPPVLIELWNGVRGKEERKRIREIQDTVPILPCTREVFDLSYRIADRSREAGLTVPAIDILIFAVAWHHHVPVESLDQHFAELARRIRKI